MSDSTFHGRLRHWAAQHPRLSWPLRLAKQVLGGLRTLGGLGQMLMGAITFARIYLWLRYFARKWIPLHGSQASGPQIVMVIWGHLPTDPRVEREARALAAHGFHVKVLCPEWSPPSPAPDWGPGIEIRLLDHSVVAPMAQFPWLLSRGILKAALEENPWAYHAHDLHAVLPVLYAAACKGVPCVCDFHEWYSENVSYNARTQAYGPHPWLKRWLFRAVEKLALRSASRMVTVCDSIAGELAQMYAPAVPVAVVRNIPPIDPLVAASAPAIDIRRALSIPAEKAIVLYQGGVGPSRGLEPLIAAMGLVQHAVLVIRGPGMETHREQYLRLADQSGASGRVFCLPPVISQRCVVEAKAADLGYWTLMPICKNFTYALPNKVFEYLAAGLPLVCAHHPEVARIINGFDVGRCFDPEDPRSIAAAIDQLAGDAAARQRCRANIGRALAELQAEREWLKLVDLYRGLAELPRQPDVLPLPADSASGAIRQKAG
jgi:glycosyltransferase involved in cell wall biosynthesis